MNGLRPRARSDSNTWRLRDGATSSHLRMRKQRERASSQNCQVTEKLPPQPSPPPFWRSQHHTLTWQRRGAPPAPLLPHPSPPKKACPASEGKKNKPYRPRRPPPRPHAALLRSHIFLPGFLRTRVVSACSIGDERSAFPHVAAGGVRSRAIRGAAGRMQRAARRFRSDQRAATAKTATAKASTSTATAADSRGARDATL